MKIGLLPCAPFICSFTVQRSLSLAVPLQSFAESALCFHSFENTAEAIGHHDYILRPTKISETDNRKEFILSSRFCKAL